MVHDSACVFSINAELSLPLDTCMGQKMRAVCAFAYTEVGNCFASRCMNASAKALEISRNNLVFMIEHVKDKRHSSF